MMWNALVSGLLVGSSIVLIDGNPLYPDLTLAVAARRGDRRHPDGRQPRVPDGLPEGRRRTRRRSSTCPGSGRSAPPAARCPAEGFQWVAEQFGPDVLLNVGSGGTDVCSGIVQGSPLQPVWAGEISGPCLGVAAKAFDEHGNEVPAGELGELVITAPMPSMPVGFWGDDDGSRYRAAYFDDYPGIWRHGDWIRFSRSRELRHRRPLGRHAEPRRRPAGHRRVLPGRRGTPRRRSTAWWCTWRTRRAATGSCCSTCSSDPAPNWTSRCAARIVTTPADVPVAAAHPGHHHRGAGDPTEPDREEAGAAGEEDPARRPAGRRRQPRGAGRPDLAGLVSCSTPRTRRTP